MRYKSGAEWTSNPNGRPKGALVTLFREALSKVETEKKMTLFEHAARMAFRDNQVLIAILKKILPDLTDVLVNSEAKIKLDDELNQFVRVVFARISGRADSPSVEVAADSGNIVSAPGGELQKPA